VRVMFIAPGSIQKSRVFVCLTVNLSESLRFMLAGEG